MEKRKMRKMNADGEEEKPCREICNVSDWIFKEKILKEMRLNRLFGVVKVHDKFVFCEFSAYS